MMVSLGNTVRQQRLTDGQVALENDAALGGVLRHVAQLAVQVPLQPAGEVQPRVVLLVRAPQPLQQLHTCQALDF